MPRDGCVQDMDVCLYACKSGVSYQRCCQVNYWLIQESYGCLHWPLPAGLCGAQKLEPQLLCQLCLAMPGCDSNIQPVLHERRARPGTAQAPRHCCNVSTTTYNVGQSCSCQPHAVSPTSPLAQDLLRVAKTVMHYWGRGKGGLLFNNCNNGNQD